MAGPGAAGFIHEGLAIESPQGLLTVGVDTTRQPLYTVGEVSKLFFARSADWIRWRERKGEITGDRRSDSGSRVYTITDVEAMIYSLARKRAIDGSQAAAALAVVASQLLVWGYHCRHQRPADSCEICWKDQAIEAGDLG